MFKNYLLTAYGVYMRRKLFTAINLLCITLTLVILLVATALLQNAFYPTGVEGKSDRFLQVFMMKWTGGADSHASRTGPLGYKVIDKYLRPMKSVEMVAAVTSPSTVSVYQPGKVTELLIRRADAEYWKILDFNVISGRVPSSEDVQQGRFVIVLNQSSARKLFPDSKDVLGQHLNVGGQQFEVIGVVEDVLQINAFSDLWAPVTTLPASDYRNQLMGDFSALLLARNKADLPLIQEEIQQVAKNFEFDDPVTWKVAYMWADSKLDMFSRVLLGTNEQADSGATMMLSGFAGMALLFMLLPALNLVNLNTGRILERSSEIGVRKAFGASSNQLVTQLVIENVLLCLVGGALGLVFAKGALLWLEGSGLIPYLKVELNLVVFACGLVMTLVFGLLSGVIPAWKMSRLDPVHALKGAA
jgi:putative ABC transport system permease protein